MKLPLYWSAVNISDGRNHEELAQLVSTLKSRGANLADWSSDSDHHRSVFSFIGNEVQLLESLEILFQWAEEHLDLKAHIGVHPRLGAVDVVPFVPLGGTHLDPASAPSHQGADAIARRSAVPNLMYRESSPDPENPITLPQLRRGGPESLRTRMASLELENQYGPKEPHPSLGVSVFGARTPLVAFNCTLNTSDLEIGRQIAGRVRGSGGGLPGLQALAFPLETQNGKVQISMNLIDPTKALPHLAFLEVCRQAKEYGVEVTGSEVVGLLPQSCLFESFRHFLKAEGLRPEQIIESHL